MPANLIAKLAIVVLIIILFLLIILSLTRWYVENKVLFYPSNKIIWIPDNFENIFITDPDNKQNYINAWYFNNGSQKLILYCHGNSGNISYRDYIVNFCRIIKINLLLFDYNGYGLSSSRYSIPNLFKNGIMAYNYAVQRHQPDDIIVWGESLGGAVAIYIAAKCKCSRLLLLATFSSLADIINYDPNYPSPLNKLVSGFVNNFIGEIHNDYYIKQVKCPVAILHSPEDIVIPYRCGEILYNTIPHNNKIFLTIAGSHSAPIITGEDIKRIADFCDLPITIQPEINEWLEKLTVIWKQHQL